MAEEPISVQTARARLTAELKEVRRLGIVRVESSEHKVGDLTLLREFSSIYAGQQSFVSALEILLRAAIERLSEGILKETGYKLYGFHADITNAQPSRWRQDALRLHPLMGMDVFRKTIEPPVMSLIAGEIEALVKKKHSGAPASRITEAALAIEATRITLSPGVAAQLIHDLLPSASQQDSLRLSSALGNQRYAIEQVCAYLARNRHISVIDFCYMLARDAELVVETVSDQPERALNFTYRRIVSQLAESEPRALKALKLLAFTSHVFVPAEYIMAYLLGQPFIKRDDLSLATLAFDKAVKPLQEHGLVELKEYILSMNPLTQEILRSLFYGEIEQIFNQASPLYSLDDGDELIEHGWGAFTIAGRSVSNFALWTRFRDWKLDGGVLMQQGKLGGPEWNTLITMRILFRAKIELVKTFLSSVRFHLESHMQDRDVAAQKIQTDPFGILVCSHPLQIAELKGMQEDWDEASGSTKGQIAFEDEHDSVEGMSEVLGDFLALTSQRYIDTGLGRLDFTSVDPEWKELNAREFTENLECYSERRG